jgi:hypothetical protein
MKTTIVAVSAAALIAATPAVLAQGVPGKTAGLQHKATKKHHAGVSRYVPRREMQAKGSKNDDPAASRYAPGEGSDFLDSVRRGGGGGGGGSGM